MIRTQHLDISNLSNQIKFLFYKLSTITYDLVLPNEPNIGQASRLDFQYEKIQNKPKILRFQFKFKDLLKNKANYLVNPVYPVKKAVLRNKPKVILLNQ